MKKLFEDYKNNGDYMDLKSWTIDFIKRDKEEHKDNQDYKKEVIHNLELEYNAQEVANSIYQNLRLPMGIGYITCIINILLSLLIRPFDVKSIINTVSVLIAIIGIIIMLISLLTVIKMNQKKELLVNSGRNI